jgi:hypothetical protein
MVGRVKIPVTGRQIRSTLPEAQAYAANHGADESADRTADNAQCNDHTPMFYGASPFSYGLYGRYTSENSERQ